MNKLLFLAVLIIFTFAAERAAPAGISDFEFKKVGVIKITADGAVDEVALRNLIEIAPDDTLTIPKIRRSIELLYATGNFTNILVDATMVQDRVQVTFIFKLVYRLESIRLVGNMGISSGRIRRKIKLRRLEPYTPEKVLSARMDILRVLRENGFYHPEVRPDLLLHRTTKEADLTYTINAQTRAYVGSLMITGDPHFSAATITKVMKSRPGRRFRELDFGHDQERIEAVYDKNGFLEHQIRVAKQELTSTDQMNLEMNIIAGKQLIFHTTGIEISDRVIRDNVPIWLEHSYSDDTLAEGKRNLLQYLQKDGYSGATLEWSRDITPDKIVITAEITPGQRYKVDKIIFSGNEHIPGEEIKKVMQTKESGLLEKSRLVRSTFDGDIKRILSLYRQNGYLFTRVVKQSIEPLPDGKIHVEIGIDEGPLTTVAEIRLTGNKAISSEEFLQKFQQKVGEPVSESKVKFDSNYVIALYSDRGYSKVQVENKLQLSLDKTQALILYNVTEGEQIFVDRIVISGNWRTKRNIISENLLFGEKDPLSLRKIAESQRKLYGLELFDRVDIDVPRPDGLQQHQDVYVRLTETKPYTISYGIGYQSYDLLRGVFGIANRNLHGTDREISLQLRGGVREGRALFNFADPHFPFYGTSSTFTTFIEKRSVRPTFAYTEEALTFQIQKVLNRELGELEVGQRVPALKSLFFRYAFENIDTTGTPTLDPQDRPFLAILISSIAGGYVRDGRDNPIEPRHGTYWSSDLQWATSYLGGQTDFLKSFTEFQHFAPFDKTVFVGTLRVGLAKGFRDTNSLPLSQRFFAGGGRTIRGFDLDTAGPLDENGDPLGGNMMFVMNIENRYPIVGNVGGVIFFDYGNVFPFVPDFRFSELRKTAGIGLRYKTPIGPLSLDWGYKLDRRFEPVRESPSEFFFSIGYPF